MAELKYWVKSKETGNVYGPMSAGDRGNHVARGYKDVTAEHTEQAQAQASGQEPQERPAARPPRPGRAEQPAAGEQAPA